MDTARRWRTETAMDPNGNLKGASMSAQYGERFFVRAIAFLAIFSAAVLLAACGAQSTQESTSSSSSATIPAYAPIGVLSLDAGVQDSYGATNLGESFAKTFANGSVPEALSLRPDIQPEDEVTLASLFSFTVFNSREDLDAALKSNELYGAIIIPENFTQATIDYRLALEKAYGPPYSIQADDRSASTGTSADASAFDTPKPALIILVNDAKDSKVADLIEARMQEIFGSIKADIGYTIEHTN